MIILALKYNYKSCYVCLEAPEFHYLVTILGMRVFREDPPKVACARNILTLKLANHHYDDA